MSFPNRIFFLLLSPAISASHSVYNYIVCLSKCMFGWLGKVFFAYLLTLLYFEGKKKKERILESSFSNTKMLLLLPWNKHCQHSDSNWKKPFWIQKWTYSLGKWTITSVGYWFELFGSVFWVFRLGFS